MAEEYYIREADQEEARGPFNMAKLVSLAEANQVHKDTLYYDEKSSQWVAITANDRLRNELFPERKKLSLKPKSAQEMQLLNEADEDDSAQVSVNDLLAAAEGETDETRHLKEELRDNEQSAKIAPMSIGAVLIAAAISNILPNMGVLNQLSDGSSLSTLIAQPLVVVGLLDAFLALCMFLAVTDSFPIIRFRAAVGFGYFGFLYWSKWYFGDQQALYIMCCALVGSLGLYVSTITLNSKILIASIVMGLAGMGGMAYFLVLAEMLGLNGAAAAAGQ